MSNGAGTVMNLEEDFKAYDRLPKKVRDFLKDGLRNVTAAQIIYIQKRLSLDADELLEEIQQRFDGFHDEWIREDWQGLKGEHPGLKKFRA